MQHPATEAPAERLAAGPPLSRAEVLLVAAGWSFYALLNSATGVLYGRRVGLTGEPVGIDPRHLMLPAVWAALTLAVLAIGRRVQLDRAFWRRRAVHVLVVGVLAAWVTDAASDALWDVLTPRPAGADASIGRRFRPSALNLTWLDDFGVFAVALAIATARGYVLRERARHDAARRRSAELEAHSARAQADAARLQAQLAEAQLDALRRQLDPHFLFNTLNAVSALVEHDPRGVRRMIGQLSDLLRHSMNDASSPEIPLRQELDLLERYVDIMRVRFDGQVAIESSIDPRALDALVPNLVLQPLVENAFRHGVEQRPDGGRIEIAAVREGDALVLRVRDDGPEGATWVPPLEADVAPSRIGGGLGLRNTAARLAQLYGPAHGLSLAPAADGGTVAEVRIPFRTGDSAPPAATAPDAPAPDALAPDATRPQPTVAHV